MFWASLKEAEEAARATAEQVWEDSPSGSGTPDPLIAHEALMAELTGIPTRTA
jgi:hypothetical protein